MIGEEYKWYAIYVSRHHEKKAYDWIKSIGVEVFLPIRKVVRRWSDRLKIQEEPLFPSYVFVKVSCLEYFAVLRNTSVIKYICFGGEPAEINESQINDIKKVIESGIAIEASQSDYNFGEKVIITQGPLIGIKGKLLSFMGNKKLRIEISSIGYSLLISVPSNILSKIIYE